MKITAMLGSIYSSWLQAAWPNLESVDLRLITGRDLMGSRDKLLASLQTDVLFIQDSGERFQEAIKEELESWPKDIPWLKLGHEPTDWAGNVDKALLAQAQMYLSEGGPDNGRNFWLFLKELAGHNSDKAPAPVKLPSFGLWHPKAPESCYKNMADFWPWLKPWAKAKNLKKAVGLLASRFYWAIAGTQIEAEVIKALEAEGLMVMPVFAQWETGEGALGWLKEQFTEAKIAAIVKFTAHFSNEGYDRGPTFIGDDSPARAHVGLFRSLNVPVFQPLASWSQSNAQWLANPRGIGLEAAWSLTLTEFEGVIEPFYVGGTNRAISEEAVREGQPERARRLAQRVAQWVRLKNTPPQERKVAFILHNAPCASVEATVGVATGLDAAESLAQVAKKMKEAGYDLEPPESGEKLIETILAKKALADFRWTSSQEIVAKGGALALVGPELYAKWHNQFPAAIQKSLAETWGQPPGETIDEVPPAMVENGQIIISGLPLGQNALVLVQPKRGCAGGRCDGRVCRILQDPLIPPPHQYLATYHWLADPEGFGAHAVIHLGTHGTVEFLPGKSAGLSAECLPDLTINTLPNLYVFEAGATGDGLTAKRRSYATLIDHQGPIYAGAQLPPLWAEVADLLDQLARTEDPKRQESFISLIREKAAFLGFKEDLINGQFADLDYELRKSIALLVDSLVETGARVLGEELTPESLVKLIAAILRFEGGEELSFRSFLAQRQGWDLAAIISEPNWRDPKTLAGAGTILASLEALVEKIIAKFIGPRRDLVLATQEEISLEPGDQDYLRKLATRMEDIISRAEASAEIPALLAGLNAEYITPGPSAAILRGRADVLPTGRNFYPQDPRRMPTKLATRVGFELAEAVCQKHWREEGRWPRSVAFFWISSDLLQHDGEDLAQMLALMGLRPQWSASGLLVGSEVIPLAELGRPRIDLTVRISGILRDAFGGTVDLLDKAIAKVASLDEAIEDNYVRAHTLENLKLQEDPSQPEAFRRATYRIFGSQPGSCQSGVYLAIMASAWRDEQDLADIYFHHGSYAYGQEAFGELAPNALKRALGRVDVNIAKLSSDAEDFLSCGGYFGTQGGLTLASELIQNRKINNYCLDARHHKAIRVRSLTEEISRSAGSRLLNPAWIANQKKSGYKGAMEIAKRVGNAYGWQATAKVVDPAIFEGVTKTYFLDEENRAFFEKHNPYALEEMGRRLLEAASRDLWAADPDLLERLKAAYLSLEGTLEERTETYGGDIQGGSVDILTANEVASWREKMDLFRERAATTKA